MEPNFQSPVSSSDKRPSLGIPFLILIFLLLLVLLFVLGKGFKGGEGENQAITKEDVIVNQTDLTSVEGGERAPLGFPDDIPKPLSEDTVTESYSMNYTEKGVTLYSFAFDTGRPFEEMVSLYADYITTTGYTLGSGNKEEARESFFGNRKGDDLTIIVSKREAGTYVQLAYLDRQ